jgi:hypothetical protein
MMMYQKHLLLGKPWQLTLAFKTGKFPTDKRAFTLIIGDLLSHRRAAGIWKPIFLVKFENAR